MKTEAETIMDGLCNFLNEATLEMLILVQMEEYEEAAGNRDDIDSKIEQVTNALLNNNWTTLTKEQITLQLNTLRDGYIKRWEEQMDIPTDSRIRNI